MGGVGHARLSPSAAERWLECPASIRLEQEVPAGFDDSTAASREGTACHTVAETHLREFVCGTGKQGSTAQLLAELTETGEPEWDIEHMDQVAQELAQYVRDLGPGVVLVEQRVRPGLPECYGTADVIHLSEDRLTVIDLKYGRGTPVPVEENPQLMLYGLGAMDAMSYYATPEPVSLIVFQPRNGGWKRWDTTRTDLLDWRRAIRPIAEEALEGSWRFGPSDTACRWCPVSGSCAARARHMIARDFSPPDHLSGEELAKAKAGLPSMRAWLNDIEAEALRRLLAGEPVPGFKVVRKGGKRSVVDWPALQATLRENGFPDEATTRTGPQTLGALEKVCGKSRLYVLAGDSIKKGEGSLSVVPEDDTTGEPLRPELDFL